MSAPARPILRFAPTPNGRLHLGHAYSALMNEAWAARLGGRLLLRIEDLDAARCKPEYVDAILDDLLWLGVPFEAPHRLQSEHLSDFDEALGALERMGLLYPCACGRADSLRLSNGARDPDGAPRHGPRACAHGPAETARLARDGAPIALRLDTARAVSLVGRELSWREFGEAGTERRILADPLAWGDVVLKGKQLPASYHLAVVVDDALQGVSEVVRGRDLFAATAIHVLLQALLKFDAPNYRHHRLVLDTSGKKLSKSAGSDTLNALRGHGASASDIRAMLGFAGREASVALSWS